MINKICLFLTNKIRKEIPDIDDERAEVINYGLQIIIGEVPKTFIMLGIAYLLGVFKLSLITFAVSIPYRGASGGLHLHTHLGCIIATCVQYCGVALLSKYIVLSDLMKYILIGFTWIFSIIMIKLYAPADTEDVPILESKVRKKRRILSYISLTVELVVSLFVQDGILANILIFANLVQTLTITKLAYRLTNNKYGYEVYG